MKSYKELTEKDILLEISKKLDYLIALTSVSGKEKDEQIKILCSNFNEYEIANILNIPRTTVQSAKKRLKIKK